MGNRILLLALSCCLLCGCASLLERQYATVEAHSSKFWESEATGTLRAESYQDIVNDLMLLIGQHTEQAVIRLYNYEDGLTVSDALEKAAAEVQQETPLGNYAVEYITSTSAAQRGFYELSIQIGYRRTAEQIKAIVNATSVAAVPSLLEAALNEGQQRLTVRVSYWRGEDQALVEQIVTELRQERALTESPAWQVSYYPPEGSVGLIEFDLDPPEAAEDALSPAELPGSGPMPADPAERPLSPEDFSEDLPKNLPEDTAGDLADNAPLPEASP